jgi:phosphoribosylaminoimidazole-succinocarboxamide synthase
MENNDCLLDTDFPRLNLLKKGKVRDVYDLGDKLLIVATDRISCFDVVLPNGIPGKGEILTRISLFWFDYLKDILENHLICSDVKNYPEELAEYSAQLANRSMLVKKAEPLPIECIVRGYLSGSGWKEYQEEASVCGIKLPAGLKESAKLPEAIFTPSTKADFGHDINIGVERAEELVGFRLFRQVKEKSLSLYKVAADYAESKGIIIADTKFEFGIFEGKLILIDEALTPDSSRFWPKAGYQPGRPQPSFDKQFVRDFLETLDWDKTPPAPNLPKEIIASTREKYLEAYRIITGKDLI